MGSKGLRVLAFAARLVRDDEQAAMTEDPMSLTRDLSFVGLTGIIDPLRAEAKAAVATALTAGIDVRMITGDHAVTARAIGEDLGLGPGAISGAELQALGDAELKERLPDLHVFGRVTPEDKLRLARAMQEQGLIVAMTGDAVNDAAALKQADIGVAMGSGSEVTKQAARMVLTDDNFGTLVHAVEIGRRVYDKVVSYVRYQMTQLLSLVFLFLVASIFDINEGVAMTPSMVLFLLFFATASGVVIIAVDPGDPDVMHRPPRDPGVPITNRSAVTMWIVYAFVLFVGGCRAAGVGTRRAEYRHGDRVDDHDVRRDGSGHGVQRPGQPARPHERPHRADREGPRHRARPGRNAVPRHPAADAAGGTAHCAAHRGAVARVRRAGGAPADRRRGGKAGAAQAGPRRCCPAQPAGRGRPRAGENAGRGPGTLASTSGPADAEPAPTSPVTAPAQPAQPARPGILRPAAAARDAATPCTLTLRG